MILHITAAEYLSDYRIRVRFNNGVEGEVDLRDELTGEIFVPLRDRQLFSSVRCHPLLKTVTWDNGADLAPEFLLDLLYSQQKVAA